MQSISQAKEDYLRALFVLGETSREIKSSEVAKYLSVSKPTVSEMMKRLKAGGLVSCGKYARIRFTKKGFAAAQNLTAKHRTIELFLKKILKLPDDKLHEEAHRLEHAFSEESMASITKILGNPKYDPHGKPIPAR